MTPTYTLYNGDCLDILPTLEAGSVDVVVTDIPYGKVNRVGGSLRVLDKGIADIETFDIVYAMSQIKRLTNCFHIFCGTEQVSGIRENAVNDGWLTRLFVWEKTNPSPMNGELFWLSGIECAVFGRKKGATFNEFCVNPVWRGASVSHHHSLHPTQKPVPLLEYLIKAYTNEGDTVLDFTMGSGSTGVACMNTNRNFIGIELEFGYCDVAGKRIQEAQQIAIARDASHDGQILYTDKEVKTQIGLFDHMRN